MPLEIECKLRVDSHDPTRAALAARRARFVGRHLEINRMFDRADRSLRAEGCGLRIREQRPLADDARASAALAKASAAPAGDAGASPDSGAAGGAHGDAPRVTVTYKGQPRIGSFKSREEIEFAASDGAAAGTLLAALGFEETLRFEKRRESWRLDACAVELDELPLLGCFVEVEGPSEAAVRDALALLGLSEAARIADTYPALVDAHLAQRRPPERVLEFR